MPDLFDEWWLRGSIVLVVGCGDAGSASSEPSSSSAGGTGSSGEQVTTTAPTGSDPGTSTSSDTSADEDTGGESGTTEDVAPPLPTGWAERTPPGLCDAGYPIAVEVHRGFLFVGTSCGQVFRSPDAGVTWEDRSPPGVNGPQAWDFVTHGETLYVALRGSGVRRTATLGDSWEDFSGGLSGFGPKGVLDLHRVGETLYIATFGGGVLATGVDAADWQPQNSETSDPMKQSPTSNCPNTPGYLDPVTMQPMTFLHGLSLTDDGTYLYYGNKCGGVYRTPLAGLPGGAAWEGYGAGLPFDFSYFQDPFALAFDGTYVYAGIDDEGAYRTLAGQPAAWTWVTAAGLIYDKLDIIAYTVTPNGVYIGASFGGAYFSATGDSPWTQLNMLAGGNLGGAADTIYNLAHDAQHVYAAADTGLYVSL